MERLALSKTELRSYISKVYISDYEEILKYTREFISPVLLERELKRKNDYVDLFATLFADTTFLDNFLFKLYANKASQQIYNTLVWEKEVEAVETLNARYHLHLSTAIPPYNEHREVYLKNELALVKQVSAYSYRGSSNNVMIQENIRELLRLVLPLPKDYYIVATEEIKETEFSYNNEAGVLNFLGIMEEMMQNSLVEFGKTNEKPLAKSLNILKSSSTSKEFYTEKKLDSFATDMLTRSFYYYYSRHKKFEAEKPESLKQFVLNQLEDNYYFFISRIFLSYLKKVRYDGYYSSERTLLHTLKYILKALPQGEFVSMQNIIHYCQYRDIKLDLESPHKTDEYNIECDFETERGVETDIMYVGSNYDVLFLEPLLKASMFYFGALGILELRYDEPVSPYIITAKGKPYLTPWDSLSYVKLTKLGEFVFGLCKSYEYKEVAPKKKGLKFDEFKPIITVGREDTIMRTKLEAYADKYDGDRYILSYAKIFKDCKSTKLLQIKIDGFYKQIEANPPKIFKEYFTAITANANLLKRDLKQVVIELKNNPKLLQFFMKNKKLHDLVIKAEGYRVIVLKENIPKLTKIVKENGFFVEF